MTHSIGGGLTVRSIVRLARAAGLALPADVEQLVEIAETVRTTKDSRAEQSPGNCLREVALTPASAAGALRDLALARARAAEMDQAGYEWLNEIDRRTKIALSQHAEQLITELAAVFEEHPRAGLPRRREVDHARGLGDHSRPQGRRGPIGIQRREARRSTVRLDDRPVA